MQTCGHKNCRFRTNQQGRMDHHRNSQHGGRMPDQKGKEFRGHVQTPRNKKKS